VVNGSEELVDGLPRETASESPVGLLLLFFKKLLCYMFFVSMEFEKQI
jgi:hypothetical protein